MGVGGEFLTKRVCLSFNGVLSLALKYSWMVFELIPVGGLSCKCLIFLSAFLCSLCELCGVGTAPRVSSPVKPELDGTWISGSFSGSGCFLDLVLSRIV